MKTAENSAAASSNVVMKPFQPAAPAGLPTGSELEVDELIVRVFADLEQDDDEQQAREHGDPARGRQLVDEIPGRRPDDGEGRRRHQSAPFEAAADGAEAEKPLVDGERGLEARG